MEPIYLPQAWTKTPIGKIDGQDKSRRQSSDEHVVTSAGTNEQLQPEVPSTAGRMGETTDEWQIDESFGFLDWYRP